MKYKSGLFLQPDLSAVFSYLSKQLNHGEYHVAKTVSNKICLFWFKHGRLHFQLLSFLFTEENTRNITELFEFKKKNSDNSLEL